MKRSLALLTLLVSPALFAQRISVPLDRMEAVLRDRAVAIRREAFIVSQLVAAAGELEDFQRNAALGKARDRVVAAQRRAMENPQAPPVVLTAIRKAIDLVTEAQKQGASADTAALRKNLICCITHDVQQMLFKELEESRADRQALTDLQIRLARMTNELDQAFSDALGSTFDYFRAGGQ